MSEVHKDLINNLSLEPYQDLGLLKEQLKVEVTYIINDLFIARENLKKSKNLLPDS